MAQSVPGVGTSSAPAAVIAPDGKSVFLAWKGLGNDQRIFWTQTRQLAPPPNTGQYTFSPSPQSEASDFCTTDGPALASFQGNVYMAWKGEAGDHAIYWSRWDGASWQPQTKVQAETRISPALVATHDAIFLVFQGNSDKNLWWAMLGDSVGSSNFKVIGPIKVGIELVPIRRNPRARRQWQHRLPGLARRNHRELVLGQVCRGPAGVAPHRQHARPGRACRLWELSMARSTADILPSLRVRGVRPEQAQPDTARHWRSFRAATLSPVSGWDGWPP